MCMDRRAAAVRLHVCTKEDQPLDDYAMERFRLRFARRYMHKHDEL